MGSKQKNLERILEWHPDNPVNKVIDHLRKTVKDDHVHVRTTSGFLKVVKRCAKIKGMNCSEFVHYALIKTIKEILGENNLYVVFKGNRAVIKKSDQHTR